MPVQYSMQKYITRPKKVVLFLEIVWVKKNLSLTKTKKTKETKEEKRISVKNLMGYDNIVC